MRKFFVRPVAFAFGNVAGHRDGRATDLLALSVKFVFRKVAVLLYISAVNFMASCQTLKSRKDDDDIPNLRRFL